MEQKRVDCPKSDCSLQKCPDEEQLLALIEGRLTAEQVEQMEALLDQCPLAFAWVSEVARELRPSESGDAEANSEEPPPTIGRYQVRRFLGAGGMGVVYEAYDEELQRRVALKLLRPDVVDPSQREAHQTRMLREARLLASLHHPHILTIYEVDTWKDQIFLAIQFVDGLNMRQWIEEKNPPWSLVVEKYLQAGAGLARAHEAHIIHRDIKPDNILIDEEGEVYLTDFGLARIVQSTYHSVSVLSAQQPLEPAPPFTAAGDILGTPAYMAPEQYRGQGVSKRSDQFSFCVSLYEALYGMRPFAGHTMEDLMEAAQRGEVFEPRYSQVPLALYRVLARGLHPLPRERFASIHELLDELRQASAQPAHRLRPLAWGGASFLVLLLGLLAFLLPSSFWQGPASSPPPRSTTHPTSTPRLPPSRLPPSRLPPDRPGSPSLRSPSSSTPPSPTNRPPPTKEPPTPHPPKTRASLGSPRTTLPPPGRTFPPLPRKELIQLRRKLREYRRKLIKEGVMGEKDRRRKLRKYWRKLVKRRGATPPFRRGIDDPKGHLGSSPTGRERWFKGRLRGPKVRNRRTIPRRPRYRPTRWRPKSYRPRIRPRRLKFRRKPKRRYHRKRRRSRRSKRRSYEPKRRYHKRSRPSPIKTRRTRSKTRRRRKKRWFRRRKTRPTRKRRRPSPRERPS